jgi:hypothetical protein
MKACPMTTGIFAGIAANATVEAAAPGKTDITPYWRPLKSSGELNEKYPGGTAAQAALLEQEMHNIEPAQGNQPPRVRDFEQALVRL